MRPLSPGFVTEGSQMTDNVDVVVVGGGPVGLFTATRLAKAGISVVVLEEHSEIGKPVQCAGLVTPRVLEMVDFPFSRGRPVRGAAIYPPEGEALRFKAKRTKAMVVDRCEFDQHVAAQAVRSGVSLHLRSRFTGFSRNQDGTLMVHVSSASTEFSQRFRTRILVGADGVSSAVREAAGLPGPGKLVTGYQIDFKGRLPVDHDPEQVELYLGHRFAPEFFVRTIPLDQGLRVGLCYNPFWVEKGRGWGLLPRKKPPVTGSDNCKDPLSELTTARTLLLRFLRERLNVEQGSLEPVSQYAGAIAFDTPRNFTADNVALVGDAAAQAKASSGGGIYTGFASALLLVGTIQRSLEMRDHSQSVLAGYQKAWSKGVGKELRNAYRLHKALAAFSDTQLNNFIHLLNDPQVIRLIEGEGDIDYPSRLAFSLFKRKPKLITAR